MSSLNTYYEKSQEVKLTLNKAYPDMTPEQQLKAKQILESFDAAEATFLQFTKQVSALNDAVAWWNQLNKKADGNYSEYWRNGFNKLKSYCNGNTDLNSEIISLLK